MFKWFRNLKQKQLDIQQLEEIEQKEKRQQVYEEYVANTTGAVNGKYVGFKYRVYRVAADSYVVQRYSKAPPALPDRILYYTDDGWMTAVLDTPYDMRGLWPKAKFFSTIADAEKAAREHALHLKAEWEEKQLIGPVKDLGRLP